jgi:hypothetical protein
MGLLELTTVPEKLITRIPSYSSNGHCFGSAMVFAYIGVPAKRNWVMVTSLTRRWYYASMQQVATLNVF